MKRILSYNVNGIRAAVAKGFNEWLKESEPDIICLQELKAQPEQIETSILEELGYHCFSHSAQKKGYSGVSIFTKLKPDHVEYGMGNHKFDEEGRILRVDFGDISVLSLYIPSGTTGEERQDVKMDFLDKFQIYIDTLKKTRPKLIISGDYNICHKPIDINHPERHHKSSGFLPEEREWIDKFISSGFIDSFRKFHPEPNRYSWWSYRAGSRKKNLGWRIDYQLVSEPLENKIRNADILSSIIHSDHCPILLDIDF